MSINGKEVNPVQPYHVVKKLVPDEKSINGKEVRLVQFLQAPVKFVTLDTSGKSSADIMRLVQP